MGEGQKMPEAERVALDLATSIVNREYEEGALLPSEAALCEKFGRSRTLVREAIRRLTASRMIEKRQGVGSLVKPAAGWNLFDPLVLHAHALGGRMPEVASELIHLRRIIEVEAASLAATQMTREQLNRLEMWLVSMDHQVTEPSAYVKADVAFHEVLFEAAGNRFLKGISQYLAEAIMAARRLTAEVGGEAGLERAQAEHRAIVDAVASHDSGAARIAMATHLANTEEQIRREMVATADPAPQELA